MIRELGKDIQLNNFQNYGDVWEPKGFLDKNY